MFVTDRSPPFEEFSPIEHRGEMRANTPIGRLINPRRSWFTTYFKRCINSSVSFPIPDPCLKTTLQIELPNGYHFHTTHSRHSPTWCSHASNDLYRIKRELSTHNEYIISCHRIKFATVDPPGRYVLCHRHPNVQALGISSRKDT